MNIVLGENINVEVKPPPKVVVSVAIPKIPSVTIPNANTTIGSVENPAIPGTNVPVLPGVKGDKGDPGTDGAPGQNGTGLGSYTHLQPIPASVWVIEHPLAFKPAVTIVDSAGSVVYGDVSYSGTTVTVVFSAGFSGTAYLS